MFKERRKMEGVGVDIVELRRFKEIRFLSRVAEFFLTGAELKEFYMHTDPIAYAASRFALKEAVIKASPEPLSYHDIEVTKMGKKPSVIIHGKFAGKRKFFASLAHSVDYVAGYAIAI